MHPRSIIRSAALVLLGAVAIGSPSHARSIEIAATSRHGAWFVRSIPGGGVSLDLARADGVPGAFDRMGSLPNAPSWITGTPTGLALIFEPQPTGDTSGGQASDGVRRQVRTVELLTGSSPGLLAIGPVSPAPPLPESEDLDGFGSDESSLFVLLRNGTNEKRLVRLDGTQWESIALPESVDPDSRLSILPGTPGPLRVLARSGDGTAVAWTLAQSGWTREGPVALSADARAFVLGDRLFALRAAGAPGSEGAALELLSLRDGRATTVGSVPRRAGTVVAGVQGDLLAIVQAASDGLVPPHVTVLTSSGRIVSEAEMTIGPPVGRREVELVAALLASIGLSSAIFVFRLSSRGGAPFAMPEGWVLANALRRSAATSADILLWLVLTSLVWSIPLGDIVDPLAPGFQRLGIWPGLSGLAALAISGGLGEALSGRTLGKILLGCRASVSGGANPSLGRSFFRNFVKYSCPPIALLSLTVPDPHVAPGAAGIAVLERDLAEPEAPARD